jgi:hypothetical protein
MINLHKRSINRVTTMDERIEYDEMTHNYGSIQD